MRFHWFHLMPYPFLPDDFKQKYRSVWIDVPSIQHRPVQSSGARRGSIRHARRLRWCVRTPNVLRKM
jgi:hypothetical protein